MISSSSEYFPEENFEEEEEAIEGNEPQYRKEILRRIEASVEIYWIIKIFTFQSCTISLVLAITP